MEDAQRAELIARYIKSYNSFDTQGMAELLSPCVCFENYSAGGLSHETRGIEEFVALADSSKALFAEREQRITSLRFESTSVVAAIEFCGRLAADMPNGPPAGTALELSGTSQFFFEDGRISRVIDRA